MKPYASGNGLVDGLVSLPTDDIVKRFQTEFAEWSMTEIFPDSVFWSHLVNPLRRYDNLDGDSNKLETNKAETRDANSTGAGHGDVHIYHFQYEWNRLDMNRDMVLTHIQDTSHCLCYN